MPTFDELLLEQMIFTSTGATRGGSAHRCQYFRGGRDNTKCSIWIATLPTECGSFDAPIGLSFAAPTGMTGGSDEDDDIARFERQCAMRAQAEGYLPDEAQGITGASHGLARTTGLEHKPAERSVLMGLRLP